MSFKKFCPKCGKETSNIVGKECLNCFLKNTELFTIKSQKILVCKHCNKALIKGHWDDFSEQLLGEEVASKVKVANLGMEDVKILVDLERKDEEEYEASIKVKGIISGNVIEKEKVIPVIIKDTTCDACMKLNAEYREAIIQLRAPKKEDSKQMMKITMDLLNKEREKDPLSGTSKVIELKTGFDLWIGSKKAAAKISKYVAKIYNTELKVTSKLIGEEENGKRKYRFTFCIKN